MTHPDVIVVGAGAIGLAVADRLAGTGRSVVVVDAREPGREASWAGSGALSLIMPDVAPAPLRPLALRSEALWRDFAADLRERSKVSIEYLRSGLLRVVSAAEHAAGVRTTVAWLEAHGVEVAPVDAAELASAGLVTGEVLEAHHQPSLCQVRSPRLVRALVATLVQRGAEIRPHQPVIDFTREGDRITGVRTLSGTLTGGEVVLAAGAWAGELMRRALGLTMPVEPVRGQIALLEDTPVAHETLMVNADGSYLIPRADGRIIVGSTFERVGYDRSVTAGGIQQILGRVFRWAPRLAEARLTATWAGLRPESPDKLPYLGRWPGLDGLVMAAGHFRDGILLTPVTAEIVTDVLDGRPPAIDIASFTPNRFEPMP